MYASQSPRLAHLRTFELNIVWARTRTHPRTHACTRARVHVTRAHVHTGTRTHMHAHARSRTCASQHAHGDTPALAHTHARAKTHTHTRAAHSPLVGLPDQTHRRPCASSRGYSQSVRCAFVCCILDDPGRATSRRWARRRERLLAAPRGRAQLVDPDHSFPARTQGRGAPWRAQANEQQGRPAPAGNGKQTAEPPTSDLAAIPQASATAQCRPPKLVRR